MKFTLLKTFVTVVEKGSFTKAAEFLYLSQPTISRHISDLENALGVMLLERGKCSNNIRLTDIGRQFYEDCSSVLNNLEIAELKARSSSLGTTGALLISNFPLFWDGLYDICLDFRKNYPGIRLEVVNRFLSDQIKAFSEKEADVVVMYSFELNGLAIPHKKLCVLKDQIMVVISKNHPLAKKSSVSIYELRKERMFYMGMSGHDLEARWGLTPYEDFLSVENSVLRVIEQQGFGLLARSSIGSMPEQLVARKVSDSDEVYSLYFIWREDNANPALPPFVEIAKKHSPQ